ncbi:unnamed protein product [Ectocarpus sp. 6 AP-2014]
MADPASDLSETRMELRAVSRKLSSCEQALEGHGAYLGIRDPATLLGQLQTLQKKEEQLREVLLILLRATALQPPPLHAPQLQAPPPAASPFPLPPSTPPTQLPASGGTSVTPSRAPATTGSPRRRRPSQVETAARRGSARAGAAASGPGAASASDSSASSSSSSSSGVFDPPILPPFVPVAPATGASKTVSLHEALGIPPPAKAGAGAGEGASSRGVPYRHGQHALYRLTAPPSGGNVSASSGAKDSVVARGRSLGLATTAGVGLKNRPSADAASSSSPQEFDVASSCSGFGETSSSQRTSIQPVTEIGVNVTDGSRVCASSHGADGEHGDQGAASGSSRGDAAAESEGSPLAEAPPPGAVAVITVAGRGGGGMAATSTVDSNGSSIPTERVVRNDQQQPRNRGASAQRKTVSRQGNACGSPRSTSAAETVGGEKATVSGEDESPAAPATDAEASMEEKFTKEMEVELRRGNARIFAGLTKATTSAAARAALAVASRPMASTDRTVNVLYKVKSETLSAASTAMAGPPNRWPAMLAAQELMKSALTVWEKKFVVDEAERCVKRKSADAAERLPAPRPPPPASRAAVSAGVAGSVTIDHSDQDGSHGNASPPGLPPPEVGVLRTADAQVVASPAGDLSAASPAPAGGVADDGSPQQQPQQQQQQEEGRRPAAQRPPAADLSTEPLKTTVLSSATTAISDATVGNGQGSGDAVPAPSSRPVRKRRKSAETGGWSRYSKEDFVSGEALVLGSSSEGEEEEDEEEQEPEEEEENYTFQGQRASRPEGEKRMRSANSGAGGGDGGWGEDSDALLVDVGGDEPEDDEDALDDSGVGTTRKRKSAVGPVKKRSPPNAWKRRCADGTCQLGASFAMRGEPAKYCSAHSDAGMVNVTHRLCMDPRCNHQPSYNMPGKQKAIYCRTHKRAGMINVTSPKCEAEGCIKRPSFAFLGDRKASFCETHKLAGMINVRKKPRSNNGGSSSPVPRQRVKQAPAYQSLQSAVGLEVRSSAWSSAAAAAAAKAKAAAAVTAAGGSARSFDSPFLSDSPPSATAPAAATPATTVTPSFASVLSSLGYNVTVRRPLGDGGGGGVGVGAGAERQ